MTYSHRLATRKDLPSIVDIYNSAIPGRTSTCDLEPVSVSSRQAWFDASSPDRHPIWVGYEPDSPRTVTGYLAFDRFLNGRPGYDVTLDLAVYLHPDHHGRGQGTYLVREAIAHAPKRGYGPWPPASSPATSPASDSSCPRASRSGGDCRAWPTWTV